MTQAQAKWSSSYTYILAVACAAIGLGNIWRFPYIAGMNGGGGFVLIYIVFVFLLGVPLIMCEAMIGRATGKDPINAYRDLTKNSRLWAFAGGLLLLTCLLVLSYYAVICGWLFDYVYLAGSGKLTYTTGAEGISIFSQLTQNPKLMSLLDLMSIAGAISVLGLGLAAGIEKAVQLIFPLLFILMAVLLFYAVHTGYFLKAVNFLLMPHLAQITSKTLVTACGQAFFSLSIGFGATLVFSAYLPKSASIIKTSVIIAIADTFVAIVAGLIIFPFVFSQGIEPSAGPGLIFDVLPAAFSQLPSGRLLSSLFFTLIALAAFSSVLALFEPVIAWLTHNHKISRFRASSIIGITAFIIGLLTIFSFNILASVTFFQMTFFELIDFACSNIFLPLNAILMSVLVGWVMDKNKIKEELAFNSKIYTIQISIVRYVVPIVILMIFLDAVGIF